MIPAKVKYYFVFIGGMAFLASFSGGSGGVVAQIAHLGGTVFGYFHLRRDPTRATSANTTIDGNASG